MYEEFKLMSFQERMEAILSGILSPDLKGITLQAMRRGVAYTISTLYKEVCNFIGVDKLPVYITTPFRFCEGSLADIGVVEEKVRLVDMLTNSIYATAYEKNDAGFDIGDPSVALGTYIVNKLHREGRTKYSSLWRVVSTPSRQGGAGYGRSYVIYRLVKFFAENRRDKFRWTDIQEEFRELGARSISRALNRLGEIGVIDYESYSRDVGGGRARDWSSYELLVDRIDCEEAMEKIREKCKYFHEWGSLRKIIEYINQNPREGFTRGKLADKLGINHSTCGHSLSLLSSLGYLSYKFKGGEVQSIAKANESTILLYEEFFEPIARMCYNLDPDVQGFKDKLEYYLDHRDLWREHLKMQVYIYDKERSHVGFVGGEVRRLILRVLENGEAKKLSHIHEDVNKISPREATRRIVYEHLKILMKEGLVERVGDGWYKRVG
jgi:hypothetical protein